MSAKHMKETEDNISANLVRDKDFKIDLLNSQLEHKNNEIKDLK